MGAVEPAPAYRVGDEADFWVGDFDTGEYRMVEAALRGASDEVYMWVEGGFNPSRDIIDAAVDALGGEVFPAVRALLGDEPRPGIDGDDHVYVLLANRLGVDYGYFDAESLWPAAASPTSNEREILLANLANGVDFAGEEPFLPAMADEFARLVLYGLDPDEDAWVNEGLANLAAWEAGYAALIPFADFIYEHGVQLNTTWSEEPDAAHQGAAFLFALYAYDRFGADLIRAWAASPANGFDGLDAALDEVGADVTAVDLFTDWVVANALNNPELGGERYAYSSLDVEAGPLFSVDVIFSADELPVQVYDAAANQFGAQYIVLTGEQEAGVNFRFDGAETVAVLPVEPHSGRYMYWSNRGGSMDTTLTRAFDLPAGDDVSLTFWAWYDIEPGRDYAYIAVSTDGGQTWESLRTANTTAVDPYGLVYGRGFAGSSGGENFVPYPSLDMVFDEALAVTEVLEGGAASEAGIQPGDRIASIEGMRVHTVDEVSAVIDSFDVGDTITVSVMRDGQLNHRDVTLGESTRSFRLAPPRWVEQSVDLSDYAGQEVLLRFEYITDPGDARHGIAIDDIAIEAAGYFDDAEDDAGDWDAAGWVRMDNTLPQRFIVQMVHSTGEVELLLGPDDPPAGEWTIDAGGRSTLLIIAGATPFTTLPGEYTYTLQRE
jgi:hypothetical protein